MDEKGKVMEGAGGDVIQVTATENDDSSDEDVPGYAMDLDGMNKAYNDIQSIFAEVVRDYPDEFDPDTEKNRARAEEAAGDAGMVIDEQLPESTDSKVLGLTLGSTPNFLAATQSSAARQRDPVNNIMPVLRSRSRPLPEEPSAALRKPWRKEATGTGSAPVVSIKKPLPPKCEKKLAAAAGKPPAKIKPVMIPMPMRMETVDTYAKEYSPPEIVPLPKLTAFEERPSIKSVDLRPIEPRSELEWPISRIESRRTDPGPDLADEAVAIFTDMDEVVTYRTDTPLEALWPIKFVKRTSHATTIQAESAPEVTPAGDTATLDEDADDDKWAPSKVAFTRVSTLPTSRIDTSLDNVEHDDFASEFIKDAGIQSEKAILEVMKVENEEAGAGAGLVKNPILSSRETQTSIKLVYHPPIWPHHTPLYTTLSKLPSLRSLVLDDSKICWLRELGSSLPNLVTLSAMRCGLKSLDGVTAFPNLENLFVADNYIDNPSHLSGLRNLRFLDLSDNPIDTFEGFPFLSICTNLRCIKLMETKVSKFANFHIKMRKFIPSLRELQPKSVALHGPGVYDLYRDQDERDDEDDFEDETESTANPFGALPSVLPEEEKKFSRILHRSTGLKWREEERRLRDNIYNPGRKLFKTRAQEGAGVPSNVDEMDAYLDDLESSDLQEGGEGAKITFYVDEDAENISKRLGNLSSVTASGYTDMTSSVGLDYDTPSSSNTKHSSAKSKRS